MTHSKTTSLLSVSILLAACAHGAEERASTEVRAEAPLNDAQIAAVLDVANRGEIEQAELARERATAEPVRGYATAMITGHGAAAREQSQLLEQRGIRPEYNPAAGQLMDRSMQTQERLRNLQGAEFDRAYMQAQLDQHRLLLRMLDEELIPSAEDPQYRAFLEQLRGDVQAHLTNAERIQGELVG
jgi:putative membrane protein